MKRYSWTRASRELVCRGRTGRVTDVAGGRSSAEPAIVRAMQSVEIVTRYRDYTPYVDVTRSVRYLVDSVPAQFLVALREIVLTNTMAPSRHRRRRRVWSREVKRQASDARGLYHRASPGKAASIELFVDRVLEGLPRVVQLVPFVRDILLAKVLFHELGHHIHRTLSRQAGEAEDIAEEWARKMMARYVRRRYWYAIPLILLTGFVSRRMRVASHRTR